MAVRTFLFFLCVCAVIGCKNEPYETVPLGVTSLVNHFTKQTSTFTYRDQKLRTFFSKLGNDTLANMKFLFTNGQLQYITNDSTEKSLEKTFFYYSGDVVVDSTFYSDAETKKLIATRTVTYDADRQPLTVQLKTWTNDLETGDVIVSEGLAELEWDGGNVVHLTVSDLSTGVKTTTKDVAMGYDGEYCIYMKAGEYLYTLGLEDLYWLSKNNPIIFNNGNGYQENVYQYNRLGYPSSYTTAAGIQFGMAYTQVR